MVLSFVVHAAPDGFSINSDSASGNSDSLYRIDLQSGAHTALGRVLSLGQARIDVEGLAFAPDGTLYGVDDSSMTLFPVNVDNGAVNHQAEVDIKGLPIGGGNDFGLTFACDGTLYTSSVSTQTLYRVDLEGNTTPIGNMGANISALAAYGTNPVRLYGMGNGLNANHTVDSRTLFEIDTQTGVATAKPQELGSDALSYAEAGLAFDNSGTLWVITDRRTVPEGSFPSQILTVDTTTGVAKHVAHTASETGFESLAITIPRGCSTGSGTTSRFTVQKRFVDDNNVTPVTLNINCYTGLPLKQSQTVLPNEGVNGKFEVTFLVKDADDGELSCAITEEPVSGYSASYTCLGESECVEPQGTVSCEFVNVANGSENLCQVQNYPDPVKYTVKKQWLFEAEETGFADTATIRAECRNAWDHDGFNYDDKAKWVWPVHGDASNTATVYPDFAGTTQCRALESELASGVESQNGCAAWVTIGIGDAEHTCTIVNTVFLEGIPTLSEYGMLLFALLMLGTGMIAMRRI